MSLIHSYPWYISDWRESETRMRLNLSERGLFRELTDYCYREGSLPDDVPMLVKIAGCTQREFERAWQSVQAEFPTGNDGRRHNRKVDSVLPEIERWHEQRRNAGKKSGEARRNGKRTTVERPFNSRSTDVQREHEPSTSTTTSTTTSTSSTGPFDFESWFESLYARHPKKGHKGAASRVLSQIAGVEDPSFRDRFESVHIAHCGSEAWRWKAGARAPYLDEWIVDEGYLYPPAEQESELSAASIMAAMEES